MNYPKFDELTEGEVKLLSNGCGPEWLPNWVQVLMFSWMFHTHCEVHDFDYYIGGSWKRRLQCDLSFGAKLLMDAFRNYAFAIIGTILAPTFFLIVLLGGWTGWHFGDPRTIEEALSKARDNRDD